MTSVVPLFSVDVTNQLERTLKKRQPVRHEESSLKTTGTVAFNDVRNESEKVDNTAHKSMKTRE
jgi:hypothetical protein